MKLTDNTGELWVTAFNNVAEQIFGLNAEQLKAICDSDKEELNRILMNCTYQEFDCSVRIRIKKDEGHRQNLVLTHVGPVSSMEAVGMYVRDIEAYNIA